MAGIPSRLPRTTENEGLAYTILSMIRGTVVAVGPWLFTMTALILISVVAANVMSRAALADFRGIIIYAFALSLIAAAPFVLVTSRVLSNAIDHNHRVEAQPVLVAGVVGAAATSAALSWAVGWGLFAVQSSTLFALMQASSLAGMMWVYLAVASAMHGYKGVSVTFVVGLTVATGATLLAVFGWNASTAEMVFAFNIGIAAISFGLSIRELRGTRCPNLDIMRGARDLALYTRRYAWISVGACLGAIAVWIDKWIIWAGPAGSELRSGLVHAPYYDSAAFLAYLTIIPSLARFVLTLDGEYIAAYRNYYNAIKQHATLEEIEHMGGALGRLTLELVEKIFTQQAAICAIVVLCAPLIIEASNLKYAQVPVLRLCTIAVLFQFAFIAATSLLIFFERHREFLFLQALFLVTNAAGTMVTVEIGPVSYGFGLLVASVISGIAAYAVLNNVVQHINYFTFVEGAVRMHMQERDNTKKKSCSPNADWPNEPRESVFPSSRSCV